MKSDKPATAGVSEVVSLFPVEQMEMQTSSVWAGQKPVSKCKKAAKTGGKGATVLTYQPEFAARLLAFFDVPPFRVTEVQKKDGSIALVETASELPTFAAFARSLGVTQAQLMKWEETHADFAEAAKKARDLQGDILIQNSLRGNYSASFAVFTAKNILGWTDGKDGPAAPQTIVVRWEK
ncbi:MAG: hypothetical protein J6U96_04630 [Elusimicrobiaceae bacterium]|nr:hypothetical protein [Elusimicrobiaceae bacterium]